MALMRNKVSADAGSVSIWTVSMGLVVILLVGLGVDFGGRVAAQQECRRGETVGAGRWPVDRPGDRDAGAGRAGRPRAGGRGRT